MTTIVLLFSMADTKAQNACPLNFDDKQLETAKRNIKKWNGEIVACDVEVMQVEKGYIDKPYYKVKLENGEQFWVGGLVTSGYEKTGAKLRLLGYFSKVEKDDIANKYNNDGFHILVQQELFHSSILSLVCQNREALPFVLSQGQ
ncbi:MAG: hypothetical protein ACI7YS_18195 [Flavobacterium sp.]